MDHHCFNDLTRSLRSHAFSSGKLSCLREHAHGPFSGKQAKEVVAMFTHASEKVEALKVIQPGLMPMRSCEAASVLRSASFDSHKLAMLEILVRYVINLECASSQTEITSTFSFSKDKERARCIIKDHLAVGYHEPHHQGHHHHDHHHHDHHHHDSNLIAGAGKLAIGAGLAIGGAIKGLFGTAAAQRTSAQTNPTSTYPGSQPAGSAYPGGQPTGSAYPGGQPAGSGYPGGQPAGSAFSGGQPGYPSSSYLGGQPAGSSYPGSPYAGSSYPGTGYPGTQPAGSGYPGSAYPGHQPAGSVYPSAPAMLAAYPSATPAGSAYPPAGSTGYPAGYPTYPGARPAGAAYPGFPR